ncbi:MAG: M15 family metallopeptidase [Candidatus Saccharibacteria bacterium]
MIIRILSNRRSLRRSFAKKKKLSTKIIIITLLLAFLGSAGYGSYVLVSDFQAKQAEIARIEAEAAAAAAREAKRKEPVYINLPGAQPVRALVEDYRLDGSIWALASKSHPLSLTYAPAAITIPDVATKTDKSIEERSVRSDIAIPLKNMFDAAIAAGYAPMVGSGYRSADLQAYYFNNLASVVGDAAANQSIAKPGQSEHQLGLAVDISTVSLDCYLDDCFADTGNGQWLANNSYKFGFIVRYPKDKTLITQYQYEPWHFRYVGVELATALHDSGLTLDEAWTYIEAARTTLIDNGAIIVQ